MANLTKYTVLKAMTVGELVTRVSTENGGFDDDIVFVGLGEVQAQNNKEAIIAVTKGQSAEQRSGDFAAPATKNFPIIPRSVRTEEVDDFGQPSTAGSRPRAAAPAD